MKKTQKISTFNFILAMVTLVINFWFKSWAQGISIMQGTLLDLLLLVLLAGFTVWSITGYRVYERFLYLIAGIFMSIAAIIKLISLV